MYCTYIVIRFPTPSLKIRLIINKNIQINLNTIVIFFWEFSSNLEKQSLVSKLVGVHVFKTITLGHCTKGQLISKGLLKCTKK